MRFEAQLTSFNSYDAGETPESIIVLILLSIAG